MAERSFRVAILGTRGIPARYGGFETFAEQLSTRLVARGHQVVVYGRRSFGSDGSALPTSFRGVELRYAPTIRHKFLDTPVAAITSTLMVIGERADCVLVCNGACAPFLWPLNLAGIRYAVNVDGIERKRAKWNWVGKLGYLAGEWCSVRFASRVIADAKVIADYYLREYRVRTDLIVYGAEPRRIEPGDTLRRFGLKPREYCLYVSRLEPENNALGVIEAFRSVRTENKLVIVGDAPYAAKYKQQVLEAASNDPRVILTGFQFGEAYHELQSSCAIYIQATEVGGTHPALIEAMAHGNCIVANGTEENLEVIGEAAESYEVNNFAMLSERINYLLRDPIRADQLRMLAKQRAGEHYSWVRVTDQYERLLGELAKKFSSESSGSSSGSK